MLGRLVGTTQVVQDRFLDQIGAAASGAALACAKPPGFAPRAGDERIEEFTLQQTQSNKILRMTNDAGNRAFIRVRDGLARTWIPAGLQSAIPNHQPREQAQPGIP
jgi:hypothetical protein